MITVTLEDTRAIVKAYVAWNDRVDQRLQFLVRRNTIEMANKAKIRARKRTGRLANSIMTGYEQEGFAGVAAANVSYAPYEEFGTGIFAVGGNGRKTPWVYYSPTLKRFVRTVGNPPHPFMLPAFNEQAPIFARDIEQMIREEAR